METNTLSLKFLVKLFY